MPSSRSSIFRSLVLLTATTVSSITIIFLLIHPPNITHPTSWFSNVPSIPSLTTFFLPNFMMGDNPSGSCPTSPPLSTSKRTAFGRLGCTIYGYPSSGGVLIKEADVVDMQFLSLDRLHQSQRSPNVLEEDRFCALMRRVGATWWASEREWVDVELGLRERTELEERRLVFGWPSEGGGVWVLRFQGEREVPKDFGRVMMAVSMDERVGVMKEYGAVFYEDAGGVQELREGLGAR